MKSLIFDRWQLAKREHIEDAVSARILSHVLKLSEQRFVLACFFDIRLALYDLPVYPLIKDDKLFVDGVRQFVLAHMFEII